MSTTWICIASGPSLTKDDVVLTRGFHTIAINDNYRLAPWADVLYACDLKWWDKYHKDVKASGFAGEKWAWENNRENVEKVKAHGLQTVSIEGQAGLSKEKFKVYSGGNSGYQAINLAYHFGARKIILLGYDMQETDGNKHWFGSHPKELGDPVSWDTWQSYFNVLAEALEKEGVEVINCSRETGLTCFPRMTIEQALKVDLTDE